MIHLPHLETNVTVACQLRCVNCNHFVALQAREAKQRIADPVQVYNDLSTLSKFVHVDAWGALGGEPLLHPDLINVLEAARTSGIADVIEVWTNGIALKKQKSAFWGAVDRVVVSVYPGTLDDAEIDWIKGACRDENVQLAIKDERHVPNFERLLEPVPTVEPQTTAKYRGCFFKDYSRVADNGYFYRCCTSPFIPRLLMGMPGGTDGIKIEGLTEQGLREFLSRNVGMVSCSLCSGLDPRARHRADWREERDPGQWTEASKEERRIE